MGLGWKELLLILVIVLVIFGTKRLKNIGSDLGDAVKGFKKGVSGEEAKPEADKAEKPDASLHNDSHKD
ncbi:MAG: twin-arginine translocase TatA/TatE family subunit [Arenimonas sp.]|jgi:sec-independent protein translocase protein TatA